LKIKFYLVVFLYLTSFLCISFLTLVENEISILVTYFLLFIVGFAVSIKLGRILLFIFTWTCSILFMTFLAFNYLNIYGNYYWGSGSDELHYEEDGQYFADNFSLLQVNKIRGNVVKESHNSIGYVYLIAIEKRVTSLYGSFSTFIPRLYNTFFLCLSVLILSQLIELVLPGRSSNWYFSLTFALNPFVLWISVQVFREIVLLFLLLSGVYLVSNLVERNSGFRARDLFVYLSIALIVILMYFLRDIHAVFFVIVTIMFILFNHLGRRAIIVLSFAFVFLILFVLSKYSGLYDFEMLFLVYENYTNLRSSGGLSSLVFSHSFLPFGWILRILYAFVSPLPVVYFPLYMASISIASLLHIYMLPYFFRGLFKFKSTLFYYFSFLYFGYFLLMAFLTFTFRHIIYFLPFYYIIVYAGYLRAHNRRLKFILQSIVLFVFALVYILIK